MKRKTCTNCAEPRFRGAVCIYHDRLARMRYVARRRGLMVPSRETLEALIPSNMLCPVCSRLMNWTRQEGGSTVISLQHDRSGEIRVLCLACNSRHSCLEGDDLYSMPSGMWRCTRCKKRKPKTDFYTHANGHLLGQCKACKLIAVKAAYRANPVPARKRAKAWYAQKKSKTTITGE